MSDFNSTPDMAAADTQAQPVASIPEKKSFLSTGTGKFVAVALALGVLAIIAAVVIVLALFVFGTAVVEDMEVTVTPDESAVPAETSEAAEVAAPAAAVANAEVFTFRDIFEPLLVAIPETTTTTTTSTTTTDTANTTTAGTLYLNSVTLQDGVYVATFSLDGVTYSLTDGERVGTSPWQVVTVNESSVVMMYGDTQVVLVIGQGITK